MTEKQKRHLKAKMLRNRMNIKGGTELDPEVVAKHITHKGYTHLLKLVYGNNSMVYSTAKHLFPIIRLTLNSTYGLFGSMIPHPFLDTMVEFSKVQVPRTSSLLKAMRDRERKH